MHRKISQEVTVPLQFELTVLIMETVMTQICTMTCPHCRNTATKAKPEEKFKCDRCGWQL
jgi:transposase-like protein